MARLVFDIETNGYLEDTHTIHSLVYYNLDTGELVSCADQHGYKPIKEGLDELAKADMLIGHNIISFDIPAIQKVYPEWAYKESVGAFLEDSIEDMDIPVFDTLNASRLIWPEIKEQIDFKLIYRRKTHKVCAELGRHRLAAWGWRLGFPKDDYQERMKAQGKDPWASWNKMMQDYCEQDVRLNARLYEVIDKKPYFKKALAIEMDFQKIIHKQEQFGFPFNMDSATELHRELVKRKLELENELLAAFPPWFRKGKEFTPKGNNKRYGYTKGAPMTKVVLTEFNPSSRQHIAERLQKDLGWKPKAFTDSGEVQVSEAVLKKLPWKEAELLVEYLTIDKRLGQLAEGNKAWLKLVKSDNRIHGRVITNGAVTGRCTHLDPNVAQVPSAGPKVPYGKWCRSLFGPPEGWVQIGSDASGLELRMLAHYLARFDGGAYGDIVLDGDIHTANQEAAGLPDRNNAKTFIYAFLYGAGAVKIGSIVLPKGTEKQQRKAGTALINKFLNSIPALKKLREGVQKKLEKQKKRNKQMYLKGIDGRKLFIRSPHSALNTLFQSAGSIAVKVATIFLYRDLTQGGFLFGEQWAQMAHVHDEYQLCCHEADSEFIGKVSADAFTKAGEWLGFRIRLDGEYQIGANWAETH